jgi:hypothetical protein
VLTGCFAWWRCSGPGYARARGAGFPGEPGGLPRRAVEWAGAVRADGEDEVGRGGGAGRVVLAARLPGDRAPAGFRYHDLRHYFASLLIASGADVKTVQARLRHASAKTTLDTYGHIWPDRDESTRTAVDTVLTAHLTEQRRNSATAEP